MVINGYIFLLEEEMLEDGCKITIIEMDSPSSFEDKYGYHALFKQLNDLYRCPCGQFYEYKEGDSSKMVCPDCGREVDSPEKD
jgi:hypothetical protein